MKGYNDILDDISESVITTDDFVGTHLRFRNFMIDSFIIAFPFSFVILIFQLLGVNVILDE